MKIEDVGEIIAVRVLEYVERGKEKSFVEVAIGKPRQFPESTDYYVPYRIKGAGIEKLWYAGGVDAVQALQLVMLGIGSDLLVISRKLPGQLQWVGDIPGGRRPVSHRRGAHRSARARGRPGRHRRFAERPLATCALYDHFGRGAGKVIECKDAARSARHQGPPRAQYENWVRPYTSRPLTLNFRGDVVR